MTEVRLIVIRARDLNLARRFYESLGLLFQSEQHGSGPKHFAAQIGSVVFEIYPAANRESVDEARLGFGVDDIEETLRSIREAGGTVVVEPKSSPWGLRAVVQDPDGRKIELTQSASE